jgi:hypothetical protein
MLLLQCCAVLLYMITCGNTLYCLIVGDFYDDLSNMFLRCKILKGFFCLVERKDLVHLRMYLLGGEETIHVVESVGI